jgi:hypothetical protein
MYHLAIHHYLIPIRHSFWVCNCFLLVFLRYTRRSCTNSDAYRLVFYICLGNVTLTGQSTIEYTFSNVTLYGGPVVNVTGLLSLSGTLSISIPLALFQNGSIVEFFRSSGITGMPTSIEVTILGDDPNCPLQVQAEVASSTTPGSLLLIFYSAPNACSQGPPSESNTISGGAIAGIVIGVVGAVGAVVAAVVLVKPLRAKVFPFFNRGSEAAHMPPPAGQQNPEAKSTWQPAAKNATELTNM